MLVACESENVKNAEEALLQQNNELMVGNEMHSTLNKEVVIEQALDFIQNMSATTRSMPNKYVTSVYAWLSSEIYGKQTITRSSELQQMPDTMLYIVNFGNEEGYALVSADENAQGVVAYIEEGSLRPNDKIDNPGFQLFLEGLKDGIKSDTLGPINPIGPILGMWTNISPMLNTRWGQYAPYNKFCFTSTGEQAVAGCSAIAVAQIAAYHQHPTSFNGHSYDWDAILSADTVSVSDVQASNSVGHLVHDIGTTIGTV